ncbi:cation:proton antiporter [Cryobacterium sp. TmT2-59]|uniref:Cation:proton antiporter n=2 Tax=Cryobacterium TaxID=69578 RepID=A0AAQ2C4K2_9MICO|nr:cation:proton antiporter [Cryobacterium shii]TFC42787.1 cation:proton antiporter [Cryobacterium shii]TFC89010.1 cation:proton antiporter [Cryobacterium sp. TmT2-59]TFD11586.1 cation:proton antiporter [Cryobacterium sp. TMT4-10]
MQPEMEFAMTFQTLAIISVVALLGPLLAIPRRWSLPVMFGQLLAGILVGQTGLRLVDPTDPTLTFLADVGFALMMFVAGSHVPMRDGQLRSALGTGVARAGLVLVPAVILGVGIAALFGTLHAPLYVVLIASSSAVLVLPIVQSLRLRGTPLLQLTAQVAVADIAAIIALPLAIDPPNAARTALGALIVSAAALSLYLVLSWLERNGSRIAVHHLSEQRKFALELRLQLATLFAMAALAVYRNVSIMLAGFSFGLAVAAVGEPRRLARQLFALADGFLGPLFFVWLGASLNLLDLVDHPQMILLGLLLGGGALLAHIVTRLLGQELPLGVLSAAQLGVPVAAVTIGTRSDLLLPGEGAAVILGALITVVASALAGGRAAKKQARAAETTPAAP